MSTVLDANTLILIVALVVGLAVGWWIFKGRRGAERRDETLEAPAVAPRVEREAPVAPRRDRSEGNGLMDQGAAATSDVAGEVLGVQVHGELPGASGPPDNLETMKGVGPKFVARLHENGITRFDQLARLSANEVDILDSRMGPFKGRLIRDRVVEQASYLARGDRDGFEATFGKLGGSA